MNDKTMMENVLTLTKSLATLYCNGFIESSNKKVNAFMATGLNETLSEQHDMYQIMSENGLYKIQNVDTSKISKTCKKLKIK